MRNSKCKFSTGIDFVDILKGIVVGSNPSGPTLWVVQEFTEQSSIGSRVRFMEHAAGKQWVGQLGADCCRLQLERTELVQILLLANGFSRLVNLPYWEELGRLQCP